LPGRVDWIGELDGRFNKKRERITKRSNPEKMIKRFDEECFFVFICSKQYIYKALNKSCSYQSDSG
jgi:hypothetical protein